MTVQALAEALSLRVFHLADPARVVEDGYAGDLLSWVMGRAREGTIWITIMSNQNVAAVALMADVSCVLLADGVSPDPDLLRRAQEKQVNLLGCDEDVYHASLRLGGALA